MINRRKLLQLSVLAGTGAIASGVLSPRRTVAQSGGVTVRYYGHTCYGFRGSGVEVLVNPFALGGCTQHYRQPQVSPNLVLVSSHLLDESGGLSYVNAPEQLSQPGAYRFRNLLFKGIGTHHDRQGGKRFGSNVVWSWEQGGLKIVHLGGIASPLGLEEKIMLGKPDLLIVPVGGGVKAYNPQEAKAAVDFLQPRMVLPSHYLTAPSDRSQCDLETIDAFTQLFPGDRVQTLGRNQLTVSPQNLTNEPPLIRVLQT